MRAEVPLASFWLLYMGGLGIYFPYYSLYLRENAGLPESQVGLLLAVVPLMGIGFQSLWGHLADRSGSRRSILALVSLGSAVGWAGLALPVSFPALILATAFAGAFFTSVIPLAVSVTMAALHTASSHAYGIVRMFGTLGFLVTVLAFPVVLDLAQQTWGWVHEPGGPSEPGLALMFPVAAGLAFLSALVALAIPNEGAVSVRARAGDWRGLFRHRPFLRILFLVFACFLCMQGPIVQFPLFVLSEGGDLDTVSRLWIPMLALEVPLVAGSGFLVTRLGERGLLALGTAAVATRWLAISLFPTLPVLFATSLLHGVTVAGIVVGYPYYVDAAVPARLRSTAQGFAAMLGASTGAILSNVLAGWLFEHVGPTAPYLAGGLGMTLLTIALPFALPAPHRPETDAADLAG